MKLLWQVEDSDIVKTKEFYGKHKDKEFVIERRRMNVERNLPDFTHALLWKDMVSCLMTTQQWWGPDRPVTKFYYSQPFPLNYGLCKQQEEHLEGFVRSKLSSFGGIRFSNKLAREIHHNFQWLEERGGWSKVDSVIAKLNQSQTQQAEAEAADFIDDNLKGFGPKQARNLLQGLGLTKYEIPIDSRITKWLNNFGFPVRLSATALADRNYYGFVSQGFRTLCEKCDIYPCLLDAAIFTSYDRIAAALP